MRLAARFTDHDFEGHCQIAYHLLDDSDLLGIFLPEIGTVGLNYVEQFGDDGSDAAKVPGSHRTFERFGDFFDGDVRLKVRRVHFGLGGSKDDVNVIRFEQYEVSLQVARVFREVAADGELGWINENTDCDAVIFGARAFDKREVPLVQCAHCRDQAPSAGQMLVKVADAFDGLDQFHRNHQVELCHKVCGGMLGEARVRQDAEQLFVDGSWNAEPPAFTDDCAVDTVEFGRCAAQDILKRRRMVPRGCGGDLDSTGGRVIVGEGDTERACDVGGLLGGGGNQRACFGMVDEPTIRNAINGSQRVDGTVDDKLAPDETLYIVRDLRFDARIIEKVSNGKNTAVRFGCCAECGQVVTRVEDMGRVK